MTHDYEVEGPVMIFLTTTAHDVDEGLVNRCIVLTVDEDREQTRAIHQKQREAQTLEGLKAPMRQTKSSGCIAARSALLRPIGDVIEHLKDLQLPRRHDQDAARCAEVLNADPGCHSLAPASARDQNQQRRRRDVLEPTSRPPKPNVKLAWELTNHVLVRSLPMGVQPADAALALADRQNGDRGMRARLEIERLDYRFTRATVRRFTPDEETRS